MRFLVASALYVPAFLHAGCATDNGDMKLSFYPTEIVSPVLTPRDDVVPDVTLVVLNENAVPMTLSFSAASGDASSLMALRPSIADATESREIAPGAAFPFQLRLGSRTNEPDRSRWRASEYAGAVRVTASIIPPAAEGLEQSGPDAARRLTQTFEVPVTIRLNCDLDGDGANDLVCGGNDCDDGVAGIGPEAPEACDGVDNDCDDLVDEDCAPA